MRRKTEEAERKAAAASEEARKAAELKRHQEEDKRKQEAAQNQLDEMGLTDRSGNKKVLEQSLHDAATVVDRVSQDATTACEEESKADAWASRF